MKAMFCSKETCTGKCFVEERGDALGIRCKTCGARSSIWEMLSPEEQEFWCERVPLRKQLGALQCFCRSKTVDEKADDVHLSVNTV